MHPDDVARELEKVGDALSAAAKHLSLQNEANAALHMNDKVLYSPLTTAVINAHKSLLMVLDHISAVTSDRSR